VSGWVGRSEYRFDLPWHRAVAGYAGS